VGEAPSAIETGAIESNNVNIIRYNIDRLQKDLSFSPHQIDSNDLFRKNHG